MTPINFECLSLHDQAELMRFQKFIAASKEKLDSGQSRPAAIAQAALEVYGDIFAEGGCE